ncbi:MAG: universal stress protein [Acidobacteriota bacterium]
MRIENILVPTDFSENAQVAFTTAFNLAKQLEAKLFVLHVQDESTLRIALKEGLVEAASSDEELQTKIHQLIEMRFSSMLAGCDETDVPIEYLHRHGDPKSEIVEYAGEIRADMIVIGMRGVSAVTELIRTLLGSVTESVLRKSPCPTLVVRLDHEA